jgi:hypothetical protein
MAPYLYQNIIYVETKGGILIDSFQVLDDISFDEYFLQDRLLK